MSFIKCFENPIHEIARRFWEIHGPSRATLENLFGCRSFINTEAMEGEDSGPCQRNAEWLLQWVNTREGNVGSIFDRVKAFTPNAFASWIWWIIALVDTVLYKLDRAFDLVRFMYRDIIKFIHGSIAKVLAPIYSITTYGKLQVTLLFLWIRDIALANNVPFDEYSRRIGIQIDVKQSSKPISLSEFAVRNSNVNQTSGNRRTYVETVVSLVKFQFALTRAVLEKLYSIASITVSTVINSRKLLTEQYSKSKDNAFSMAKQGKTALSEKFPNVYGLLERVFYTVYPVTESARGWVFGDNSTRSERSYGDTVGVSKQQAST